LDRKFSEEAAQRLLKIYDSNVAYALADSDKIDPSETDEDESEAARQEDRKPPPKPPSSDTAKKVQLMGNERVLYAHEGPGAGQGFRLVVTGEVDKGLMDVLEAFVTFQQKVVGTAKAAPPSQDDAKPD
jgi:hypothetical protein